MPWQQGKGSYSPQPEERELVRRLRAGDEQAFEEFFGANFEGLYRFALARLDQNSDLARETAQATLCKAFEKLHTFRGEAALFSWLCSICRYEITGHFRRQRRRPTELIEDSLELRALLDSIPALLDDPERDLLRREVGRLVHVSLDQLPRHYGDPLRWKYADGLSVKEIASRLDVTPKAAESLMTRARRAFRKVFSSLGGAFADQFIDSECSS